jgi:23S rRNA-/tRNA-specific pseudouridylate synthase
MKKYRIDKVTSGILILLKNDCGKAKKYRKTKKLKKRDNL